MRCGQRRSSSRPWRLDTTGLLRYDRSRLGGHLLWYASLSAACNVCHQEDMMDLLPSAGGSGASGPRDTHENPRIPG